jgi:hypothetical protein
MCANGVDLGHACRLCGKPLLSCWDDGPPVSWHMREADAQGCGWHAMDDVPRAGADVMDRVLAGLRER